MTALTLRERAASKTSSSSDRRLPPAAARLQSGAMQPPYPPHAPPPSPYAQQGYAQQGYAHAGPHAYGAPGQLYRQNVFVPQGATAGPLVGPTLRKMKLATGIAQLMALFVGIVLLVTGVIARGNDSEILLALAAGFAGLWYLVLCAYSIVNLIWLYKFWSWIPPEERHTNLWKKYISPGTAIGFMFIPYFNIYWMFVVYLGIADIMERLRVQYPSRKGSAKTLAIVTTVIPFVFFPAGPFLQFVFAKHVEEMAREMHARMTGTIESIPA